MSRMEFVSPPNAWRLADIDVSRRNTIARQIADRIAEAVAGGVWRQGEVLPGIGEIARRYGVAGSTVQAGLRLLVGRGVLRSGGSTRGYYVRGVAK